jgi:integrase
VSRQHVARAGLSLIKQHLSAKGLIAGAGPVTLEAYLKSWIDNQKDKAPNTVTKYRQMRNRLVNYFGADKLLHAITRGEADEWRQSLANDKAEATMSTAVKAAKLFFQLAENKGLVRENPFDHLKAGRETSEQKFDVTREMVDKLMDHAPDAEWRAIIALARYLGLRVPSEVLPLTWDDVNWARERLTLRSPKTKYQGKPWRVLPLFHEVRTHLEFCREILRQLALPNAPLPVQRSADRRRGQARFDAVTEFSSVGVSDAVPPLALQSADPDRLPLAPLVPLHADKVAFVDVVTGHASCAPLVLGRFWLHGW